MSTFGHSFASQMHRLTQQALVRKTNNPCYQRTDVVHLGKAWEMGFVAAEQGEDYPTVPYLHLTAQHAAYQDGWSAQRAGIFVLHV